MKHTGLRHLCLAAIALLAAQIILGVALNLYVTVNDARLSWLREITTAPAALTAHVLLGAALIVTALVLAWKAARTGDRLVLALAGTGLAAILGAFTAGEVFVRDNTSGASLAMAACTGAALLCYGGVAHRLAAQQEDQHDQDDHDQDHATADVHQGAPAPRR